MASAQPLQAYEHVEYTPKQINEKVTKMELLQRDKMPTFFIYTQKLDWADNQEHINAFYAAKRVWQKNPRSFAAAFNYGLVIASNDYGEGWDLSQTQVDEALRVLEQAKKLRPDYKETYFLMNDLLEYKLFGPVWLGPGLYDEEILETYKKHPDVARRQLALLQTVFAKWDKNASSWLYFQASLISKSLNRVQDAKMYETKGVARQKQEEAASSALEKASREKQKKQVASDIKQIFSRIFGK